MTRNPSQRESFDLNNVETQIGSKAYHLRNLTDGPQVSTKRTRNKDDSSGEFESSMITILRGRQVRFQLVPSKILQPNNVTELLVTWH